MGASEKIDASLNKLKGKAKESACHLSDNDEMIAEGKADQARGDIKNAAEKTIDSTKDVLKD